MQWRGWNEEKRTCPSGEENRRKEEDKRHKKKKKKRTTKGTHKRTHRCC
jgi:hypothetical protein